VALFGFGKDKKEGGSLELVLAYLEDAQRVRAPFLVKDKRRVDVPAMLQGLDEEACSLTFQAPGGTFEKGSRIDFLFMLENLRLGGSTRVSDVRTNVVTAEIPEELELMERRKLPRARLNPKEGANVTALTNLFEGVGVNGIMESISEGGCRIRVEKALNLKDEKRLPLGVALLPKGQPFMLLKLNKVPKCPGVMELTGKVAYLDDSGGGLAMGIEFDKPRGDIASSIRSLISSRSGAIPTSIPSKARRKAVAPEESFLADKGERTPRIAAQKPAVQETAPPEAKEGTPLATSPSAETPASSSGTPQPPVRNQALLRLKKRSRSIVVMVPVAYGQLLRDFLLEDGYGRVAVATNREELAVQIGQTNVGLVFIDVEMPLLECLEMVSQLREEKPALPPVIVAAQEVSRAFVLAAHRAGVAQLVVKPYSLDETFANLFEQQMGL
jgi:CheY-like chemotaxis protein